MIEQHELIFSFEKNLNNSKYTYCKLIELYHTLNSLDQQRVILDLSNITFYLLICWLCLAVAWNIQWQKEIITITINLKDTQLYFLNQSNNDIIIF